MKSETLKSEKYADLPSNSTELYNREQILTEIQRIALQINEDYRESEDLLMIGVLKGAFMFLADLIRYIQIPVRIEFLSASSYKGTCSTGNVKFNLESLGTIKNQDVLIVEDIVDSGLTIRKLFASLKKQEPKSLKVSSLVVKKEKDGSIKEGVDYYAFAHSGGFLIGYGFDVDEKYRNLDSIFELLP